MATLQLTSAYIRDQTDRFRRLSERVFFRREVKAGRGIPDLDQVRISDGRQLAAAVLFLDICEFSKRPMCFANEQSDTLKALSLLFSELVAIVGDYNGTVEKNTGDGLMAYFPDTSAHEKDASTRAVSCAITMFRALDYLVNPFLEKQTLAPFRFRICADYGEMTLARLGMPRGYNSLVAIGSTANVTAKMLARAKAGEFLVGLRLAAALEDQRRNRFVAWNEPIESGFFFRGSGSPYNFLPYDGRWKG